MMKLALTIVAVCVALSGAATVQQEASQSWGSQQQLTGEQAVQQIRNLPHVAIPNYQHTQVAGYYIQVPYDVLAAFSYFPTNEARQFLGYLQQHGYYPIINYAGRLVGFYSQSTGASAEQSTHDVDYYVQNLYYYGLSPIVNQKNQVVGFYYSVTTPNNQTNSGLPFQAYQANYPQQYYSGLQQEYNYQEPNIYYYLY